MSNTKLIRIGLTATLLTIVWAKAHWSVALSLMLIFIANELMVTQLEQKVDKTLKTCPHCNHSLKDNSHGIDQNDMTYDEKINDYVHCGRCMYCKECNPQLKTLGKKNKEA